MTSTNATITIPIVLDASGDAVIFSEEAPSTDVSYVFDMSAVNLSAEDLSNSIQYKDSDSGETLFAYNNTNIETLRDNLATDISNTVLSLNTTDGANLPNHSSSVDDATIGEMLVKYIASVLFGHPEAQAPIENDTTIIKEVQEDSALADQFRDQLKAGLNQSDTDGNDTVAAENAVLQSIFEQLISHSSGDETGDGTSPDNNRFGDRKDTGVIHGMPFLSGDTIIFLVNMTGTINQDTTTFNLPDEFSTTGDSALNTLFGSNPNVTTTEDNSKLDLVPKIWELRIVLA